MIACQGRRSGGHEERLTLFLTEEFAAFGGQDPFDPEADRVLDFFLILV